MGKIIDETGNRYGKLLVLGRSAKGKPGRGLWWVCECDCGSFYRALGSNLRSGRAFACGCLRGGMNCRPRGEAMFNALYLGYKARARKRRLSFEIGRDDFRRLTKGNCVYCGVPPTREKRQKSCNGGYKYNGLDRVDSEKGYILSNVASCCAQCNQAKLDFSSEDFLSWIERVSSYQYKI